MNSDSRLRILCVYNYYRQPGGEDEVYESEARMLEDYGHAVTRLEFRSSDIPESPSPVKAARVAVSTIWSRTSARQVGEAVERAQADVVHFTNTFPQVSPSAYSASKKAGAAVVQTVQNYRLVCPSANLYRDSHVCEDCVGRLIPWPSVLHACYHESRPETAVVSAMLAIHRLRRTWQKDVDVYIAATEFSRSKLIEGGFAAESIFVKPNFVGSTPPTKAREGEYCLFVGRLSKEKGVDTLVDVWKESTREIPLRIAGAGPLEDMVVHSAHNSRTVRYLGRLPRQSIMEQMLNARVLIFPSAWYEGLPVTIVEAFATGLPVIASQLGAMAEIIQDGRTGLLFNPGNVDDLAAKVKWAWSHPHEMRLMGANAREEYEAKYTPERNYSMLMDIYQQARERSHSKQDAAEAM